MENLSQTQQTSDDFLSGDFRKTYPVSTQQHLQSLGPHPYDAQEKERVDLDDLITRRLPFFPP